MLVCKIFDLYHVWPGWQWQAGKEELSATIVAPFLTSLSSEKFAQLNGNMYYGQQNIMGNKSHEGKKSERRQNKGKHVKLRLCHCTIYFVFLFVLTDILQICVFFVFSNQMLWLLIHNFVDVFLAYFVYSIYFWQIFVFFVFVSNQMLWLFSRSFWES